MLWIIDTNQSHEIISCNIFDNQAKTGNFELWVTRPGGKSLIIGESEDANDIYELKDAIDYAIETNERALRLA